MNALQQKKVYAFLLLIFCVTQFLYTAPKAQAQFATTETPGALLTAAIATAASTGMIEAGVGVPLAGGLILSSLPVCDAEIVAVDALDIAKGSTGLLSSLTFGLIGEEEFEAVKIEVEQKVVSKAKACVDPYLIAVKKIPIPNLIVGQEIQRKQEEYAKLSVAYGERIEQLTSRQSTTVKQILRAILLRVLQNVEKDLTTRVVNGLVQKFKISNYLQYADALGGQVYAMDYINKNFTGDPRQQMMVRQLVQSRLTTGSDGLLVSQAFSQQKAEEFLGYDFKNIDTSDPNFYSKFADRGNPVASPLYNQMVAEQQSAQALGAGISNANLEISNGKGFLPPRDCSGSVSGQQEIDRRQVELTKQMFFARNVYRKMLDSNPQPSQSDLKAAEQEYIKARDALAALPKEVDKPVVEICKAIENPGSAVADQINNFLLKHLNQSSDFKAENLPFFVSFIGDVASNFVTNIVTGGKSTSQLLKETGLGALDSALGSTINTSTPQLPTSPSNTSTTSTSTNNPPSGNTNQSGPATCLQVSGNNDAGVRLRCETLPTAPRTKFTIEINYQQLLTEFDPKTISIAQGGLALVQNQDLAPLTQGGTPGIVRYEVDNGITGTTEFLISIAGTVKNSQTNFNRDARIRVTLPGSVQGAFTQRLSLRSSGPVDVITGKFRTGITLR
jgi:hypothetical protein